MRGYLDKLLRRNTSSDIQGGSAPLFYLRSVTMLDYLVTTITLLKVLLLNNEATTEEAYEAFLPTIDGDFSKVKELLKDRDRIRKTKDPLDFRDAIQHHKGLDWLYSTSYKHKRRTSFYKKLADSYATYMSSIAISYSRGKKIDGSKGFYKAMKGVKEYDNLDPIYLKKVDNIVEYARKRIVRKLPKKGFALILFPIDYTELEYPCECNNDILILNNRIPLNQSGYIGEGVFDSMLYHGEIDEDTVEQACFTLRLTILSKTINKKNWDNLLTLIHRNQKMLGNPDINKRLLLLIIGSSYYTEDKYSLLYEIGIYKISNYLKFAEKSTGSYYSNVKTLNGILKAYSYYCKTPYLVVRFVGKEYLKVSQEGEDSSVLPHLYLFPSGPYFFKVPFRSVRKAQEEIVNLISEFFSAAHPFFSRALQKRIQLVRLNNLDPNSYKKITREIFNKPHEGEVELSSLTFSGESSYITQLLKHNQKDDFGDSQLSIDIYSYDPKVPMGNEKAWEAYKEFLDVSPEIKFTELRNEVTSIMNGYTLGERHGWHK